VTTSEFFAWPQSFVDTAKATGIPNHLPKIPSLFGAYQHVISSDFGLAASVP
jgi:hypothetical protein